MDPEIFISYARKDASIVSAIEEEFKYFGIDCFRDVESIPLGADWSQTIAHAIPGCRAVLCLISDQKSEFLKSEVLLAGKHEKPIFPLFLKEIELPADLDLCMNRIQRITVDPSLEMALPKILSAVLPCVDRARHPTAYTAYTKYTPQIDEADVGRRSKRFTVDPAKHSMGSPNPALGEGSVDGGKYVFTSYDQSFAAHAIEALPEIRDFVFELQMRRSRGPADRWFGIEYGLHADPSGHCYQIFINGRGELRFAKYAKGAWEDPIPADKPLRFQRSTPELLKIIRNSRNLHIFVNNQCIATLVDSDVQIGRIGPVLSPGLTVELSAIRLEAISA